jgi:uncharacterized protein YxjI
MKTYTVTQKILALGATYEVRDSKEGPPLFTVRGKILTFTPYLEMMKGKDGAKTHVLKGNFLKTKFSVATAEGGPVGEIQFPFFAFSKSFTMTIGANQYNAKGNFFAWNFAAKDAGGKDAFVIQKQIALRDKFEVMIDEALPVEPIVLSAIAVDQRFFQNQ